MASTLMQRGGLASSSAAAAANAAKPCVAVVARGGPVLVQRGVPQHQHQRQQQQQRRAALARPPRAAASTEQARWEQQVRDGTVANVSAKDAGALLADKGWVLLDVRPPGEAGKVGVAGAVAVPLFVEDPSNSFDSLLKKAATIGTGGWWLGGTHMIPNARFLAEVEAKVPKDKAVVIGCQKGLRSLAAAEQLSRAGYSRLAWINGGFDAARPGDLPTVPDGKDIRYAGIGGLSEALGWTEVQQEENKGQFMGGVENIFKIVGLVLLADVLLFGYEQVMYMLGTPLQ